MLRQFFSSNAAKPDSTLPSSCVVASLTYEFERKVKQTQLQDQDPGNGPPNHLFVPGSVRSQVLQWGHSTRLTQH